MTKYFSLALLIYQGFKLAIFILGFPLFVFLGGWKRYKETLIKAYDNFDGEYEIRHDKQ